jgi:hypothetical protein
MHRLIIYASPDYIDQEFFESVLDEYDINIHLIFIDTKCQADAFMQTYCWNRHREFQYMSLYDTHKDNDAITTHTLIFAGDHPLSDANIFTIIHRYGGITNCKIITSKCRG